MTRQLLTFILAGALASACSSADQSLGETRQPPTSTPDPATDPDPLDPDPPDPDLDPDPDPDPDPGPDPDPIVPPCEDQTLHARTGSCLALALACDGTEPSSSDYECGEGTRCCVERAIGCPLAGCGGMSAGGAANGGDSG